MAGTSAYNTEHTNWIFAKLAELGGLKVKGKSYGRIADLFYERFGKILVRSAPTKLKANAVKYILNEHKYQELVKPEFNEGSCHADIDREYNKFVDEQNDQILRQLHAEQQRFAPAFGSWVSQPQPSIEGGYPDPNTYGHGIPGFHQNGMSDPVQGTWNGQVPRYQPDNGANHSSFVPANTPEAQAIMSQSMDFHSGAAMPQVGLSLLGVESQVDPAILGARQALMPNLMGNSFEASMSQPFPNNALGFDSRRAPANRGLGQEPMQMSGSTFRPAPVSQPYWNTGMIQPQGPPEIITVNGQKGHIVLGDNVHSATLLVVPQPAATTTPNTRRDMARKVSNSRHGLAPQSPRPQYEATKRRREDVERDEDANEAKRRKRTPAKSRSSSANNPLAALAPIQQELLTMSAPADLTPPPSPIEAHVSLPVPAPTTPTPSHLGESGGSIGAPNTPVTPATTAACNALLDCEFETIDDNDGFWEYIERMGGEEKPSNNEGQEQLFNDEVKSREFPPAPEEVATFVRENGEGYKFLLDDYGKMDEEDFNFDLH
jgi:hypothetical protein